MGRAWELTRADAMLKLLGQRCAIACHLAPVLISCSELCIQTPSGSVVLCCGMCLLWAKLAQRGSSFGSSRFGSSACSLQASGEALPGLNLCGAAALLVLLWSASVRQPGCASAWPAVATPGLRKAVCWLWVLLKPPLPPACWAGVLCLALGQANAERLKFWVKCVLI